MRGTPSEYSYEGKMLGEVLRERGQVSTADLSKAIEEQHGKLIHLGESMLQRGMVKKSDLIAALGEVTRVPYVDCTTVHAEPEVLKLVPRPVAELHCVLPLRREGRLGYGVEFVQIPPEAVRAIEREIRIANRPLVQKS